MTDAPIQKAVKGWLVDLGYTDVGRIDVDSLQKDERGIVIASGGGVQHPDLGGYDPINIQLAVWDPDNEQANLTAERLFDTFNDFVLAHLQGAPIAELIGGWKVWAVQVSPPSTAGSKTLHGQTALYKKAVNLFLTVRKG